MDPIRSNSVNTTWNGSSGPTQYIILTVTLSEGVFSYSVVPYSSSSEKTDIYGMSINIGGNSIYVGDRPWSNYTLGVPIKTGTISLANCDINAGSVSVSASCNFRVGTWNPSYKATASGAFPVASPTNVTLSYTAADKYGNTIVGGYSTLTFTFSATPGTSGNTISSYRLYQNGTQIYNGLSSCTITATAGENTYYVVAVESNGAVGQSADTVITAEAYIPPMFESVSSIRWTTVAGKNKYNPAANPIEQGAISSSGGADTANNTRVRTNGYISVQPSTTYTLSTNVARVFVLQYGSNENYLNVYSGWQTSPFTFTTGSNTYNIRVVFAYATDVNILPSAVEWVQIEEGSAATSWEPYSDNGSPSDDGRCAKLSATFTNAMIGDEELATTCVASIVGIGTIGTIQSGGEIISANDLSPDSSYTVIYELYDGQFTTSSSPVVRTDTITIGGRGIDLIHFGTDYGVAVGTKATAGYLDTAYPFRIRTVDAGGNVTEEAKLESTPTEITASISRTSGWTVNTAHLYTFGRIAYLSIRFNSTGTYSVGNNVFVGSISGIAPKYVAMGSGYWGSSVYNGMINSNGAITIRLSGYSQSYTFDGEAYISFMFMF